MSQGQGQVPASSSSSSVDSGGSGLNPGAPLAAPSAADGESVTSNSTCSLCAARLASSERQELEGDDDSQRVGAHWDDETEKSEGTTDTGTFDCTMIDDRVLTQDFLFFAASCCALPSKMSLFTEKPSASRRRRHLDNERGGGCRSRSSKVDRRLRRLEKMVESQSHGLIVALTQLKSGDEYAEQRRPNPGPGPLPYAPRPPRQSHAHAIKDETVTVSRDGLVDADADCHNLSSAVAGMGLLENGTENLHLRVCRFGILTCELVRSARRYQCDGITVRIE